MRRFNSRSKHNPAAYAQKMPQRATLGNSLRDITLVPKFTLVSKLCFGTHLPAKLSFAASEPDAPPESREDGAPRENLNSSP